jgi:hypothetical protein
MNEWSPIKTAPMDGTLILAYCYPMGVMAVVGYYTGTAQSGGPLEDIDHWSDVGMMNKGESQWFNHRYFTHWQPLPEPPKEG